MTVRPQSSSTDAPRPRIRDAGQADLPELRRVYREASLSNASDRPLFAQHPEALEFSGESLQRGRCRVATDAGGAVLGFATTLPGEGALELEDIFVDPRAMRRGVGRALVDDILAFALSQGVTRVQVIANPHALAFYAAVGFTQDGPVDLEWGHGQRMHCDVAS